MATFDFNDYTYQQTDTVIDPANYDTIDNNPAPMTSQFLFINRQTSYGNSALQIVIMGSESIIYTRVYDGESETFGDWQQTNSSLLNDYQGTWDASVNDPELVNDEGTKGDYYICVEPGSAGPSSIVDPEAGDVIIYNGIEWQNGGSIGTVNQITSPRLTLTVTNPNGPNAQIDLNETCALLTPEVFSDNTYNMTAEDNYVLVNNTNCNVNLYDPLSLDDLGIPNQEYMIIVHPDGGDVSVGSIGTPQPKFYMNDIEVPLPILLSAPLSYIKCKCIVKDSMTEDRVGMWIITDFGGVAVDGSNGFNNTKMVRDENGSSACNEFFANSLYSESLRRDNIVRLLINVFDNSSPADNPVGMNASDLKVADMRAVVYTGTPAAMSSGSLVFTVPSNVNLNLASTWVEIVKTLQGGTTTTGIPSYTLNNAAHTVTLTGDVTDTSTYNIRITQNSSINT